MRGGRLAALGLVLLIAGCSSAPAATPSPADTEPFVTDAPMTDEPTEAVEATPTTGPTSADGLPLSDGNGWPMSVSATLTGTFGDGDGSYSGTGPARWCGDAVMNLTGNPRAFIFEFPLDAGTGNITDVTFSADDLVPGETTAKFHIGVTVHTAAGGDPAATVIDPGETGTATSGSGSATLTVAGETRTLELEATSDDGENIKLKGSCAEP